MNNSVLKGNVSHVLSLRLLSVSKKRYTKKFRAFETVTISEQDIETSFKSAHTARRQLSKLTPLVLKFKK